MTSFTTRRKIIKDIAKERESQVLLYVTGDRAGMETQISKEAVDIFVDHLDLIGPTKKISLIIYTNGGDTAAAWRLINLLRIFADDLEVIVPFKSLSAGTLIALGANRVVMSKQATLGPIDPSLNSPLGPHIPGAPPQIKFPVSVEAVNGYMDFVKDETGLKNKGQLTEILKLLSEHVHPLVLGQIYRTRSQIRNLANDLLVHQIRDAKKKKRIVDFLCSESGSHDHTINRRAARQLGLRIENCSQTLYDSLSNLYKSFASELKLRTPYDPVVELGVNPNAQYDIPRCVIESDLGGSNQFKTKGTLTNTNAGTPGPVMVNDSRTFEGWEKVK